MSTPSPAADGSGQPGDPPRPEVGPPPTPVPAAPTETSSEAPSVPAAAIVNPYAGRTSTDTYASWGQRVGGFLLDSLLCLPFAVAGAILYAVGVASEPSSLRSDANGSPVAVAGGGSAATRITGVVVVVVGALGVTVWNRWYRGGPTGQSWGRKIMGLQLVRDADGQPPGIRASVVRDLAHLLDCLICFVGWFFPLWDPKRQTIADKLAHTLVYPGPPAR